MSDHESTMPTTIDGPEAEPAVEGAKIFRLFSAVGQYYDLPAADLADKGSHHMEVRDARAVTLAVMTELTDMSLLEMAKTMSITSQAAAGILERFEERIEGDPKLKAHVDEITRATEGEPLAKAPSSWLDLAANHYEVPIEDLVSRHEPNALKARQLGAYLLAENTVLGKSAIARKTGYFSSDNVAKAVKNVLRKSRADVHFAMDLARLEQGDLPDAENRVFIADKQEREKAADRLVRKICAFYGVDPEEVNSESIANPVIRPRRVIAYMLLEELSLPIHEVAAKLQRRRLSTVWDAHRAIRQEVAENPMFAEEIAYLKQAKRIYGGSINERIIRRVAEVTKLDPDDVKNGKDPESTTARHLAMALMLERGHLSLPAVAQFFGMATETSVYRAKELVGHQEPNNALLAQQLKWVRGKLLGSKIEGSYDAKAVRKRAKKQPSPVGELPVIDEDLVHPEIVDKIFGIVKETANFYRVPPGQVIGHSRRFLAVRARKAAIWRCRQARLPFTETAICFDGRRHTSIASMNQKISESIGQNRIFAEELRDLEEGEKRRRNVLVETRNAVIDYYDVTKDEFRSSRLERPRRARAVFLAVMFDHKSNPTKQVAKEAGCSHDVAIQIIAYTAKKTETDPRLKAEIEYFKNPGRNRRPPLAEDIIFKVCDTLGVSGEEMAEAKTSKSRRAKRMAVHILSEEMGLTNRDIAKLLGMNKDKVPGYLQEVRKETEDRPDKILEIDRLKPPYSTSFSSTARILHFAARRRGLELADLFAPQNGIAKAASARVEAADLLVRQTGFSPGRVANLLGMPRSVVENIVLAKSS